MALGLPCLAHAEPYMGMREGYVCADCHVNKTGGGMRTMLVEMHAAKILRLPNQGKGILPDVDERFSPHISRFFSVGADFRLVDTLLFQDDEDATGRVDNNTIFRSTDSNDLDVEQATVYGEVRLIPDYLSFYIDQRFAPGGASNREAFGLLQTVLPFDTYLKGGQFFPAWGLKIQDDDAFVNSASGFSFDRNITGLEVGRAGESSNMFLSVSEGADDDDLDPLVIGSGSYMWTDVGAFTSIMAGASAAYEEPGDDKFGGYTAFGGFAIGRFVGLAQGVYLDTEVDTASNEAWTVYGEANYLIANWLNAKFAFDYMDPDTNQSDDAQNRFSLGFEPFLDQFLQARLFYRVSNGPETRRDLNKDELSLELHLFF